MKIVDKLLHTFIQSDMLASSQTAEIVDVGPNYLTLEFLACKCREHDGTTGQHVVDIEQGFEVSLSDGSLTNTKQIAHFFDALPHGLSGPLHLAICFRYSSIDKVGWFTQFTGDNWFIESRLYVARPPDGVYV